MTGKAFPAATDSSGPKTPPAGLSGGLYIDELFDEIASAEPQQREALLAERCVGHPTVEAEVRLLLGAMGPPEPDDELAPDLAPGAILGRYRLDQQLGTGATATVWKAFDTQLHAFTALKLLHPDGRIRGSRALEVVLREARAASAIISDHVIRVKTAGRFDNGPHFVEMELCAENLPGPDGGEVLEIGKTLADDEVTPWEAARLVAEAARGVDAAHRAGVLHRDIKPNNILLMPVSRRAKVTDFGLAADTVFPAPTHETPATATVTVEDHAGGGRIVGTPAYMAPEHARGQPATRGGDVYALGATLYALLARRPPYEPKGKHAVPALDVLGQLKDGPPKPVGRDHRLPSRLVAIVAKAMARDHRVRYRTAGALAHDLERWCQNRSTSLDSRAPWLHAWLFTRRNRSLVGSVATLGAVLLVFAVAVAWLEGQRRNLETAIDSAAVRLLNAEDVAALAEAVRDRTLWEKEQALSEARDAEAARQLALSGQTDAEDRARQADRARADAEKARAMLEADRDLALQALDQAEYEVAAARESELTALLRAEDEAISRRRADDGLRAAELALNEAHLQRQDLEAEIARIRVGLASLEDQIDALTVPHPDADGPSQASEPPAEEPAAGTD